MRQEAKSGYVFCKSYLSWITSPVSIEQAVDVSVNVPAPENVHVKCDGDIEGELTVYSNSVDKVSIECNGDMQGDVLGNASNGSE